MDIGLYNMKFYYKYFDNNFFFFLVTWIVGDV